MVCIDNGTKIDSIDVIEHHLRCILAILLNFVLFSSLQTFSLGCEEFLKRIRIVLLAILKYMRSCEFLSQ